MTRAFLDANVIFAASYSRAGTSRALFREAIKGRVRIVASQYVLMEAERNLAQKAPTGLSAFRQLLESISVEVVHKPSPDELAEAATYTELKDAPVVAAAIKAKVDYLVTWDRKHFVTDPQVKEQSGLRIVTLDELIALING